MNLFRKSIIAASAVALVAADAAAYRALESLQLNDGKVLNGLTLQYNSDGTRQFMAESAIYTISRDSADVVLRSHESISYDKLDGELLSFTYENPELADKYLNPFNTPTYRVNLAQLYTPGKFGQKVIVLPKPLLPDSVSFLVTSPTKVNVSEDQIMFIDYNPDYKAKVGLLDYRVLADGDTLCGYLVSEVPGREISMYVDDMMHSFNPDSVTVFGYRPIDPDTEIAEQSPWIREYIFKDGLKTRGIASEVNFNSNTITVCRFDGAEPLVRSLDDYEGYTSQRNEHQLKAPRPKRPFGDGQMYVNRSSNVLRCYDGSDPYKDGAIRVDAKQMQGMLTGVAPDDKEGRFTVEFLAENPGQVTLTPLKKEELAGKVYYKATREDIDSSPMALENTTGKSGETLLAFPALTPGGVYVLAFPALGEYYFLSVMFK